MRKTISLIGLYCFLVSNTSLAGESSPADSAIATLNDFLSDWNRADLEAIQEHLSFPHVTHGPGMLIVATEEGEFVQDFNALKASGWQRSSFDRFDVIQASDDIVHVLVDFARYRANDDVLSRGQVFYVVTRQDDGWGMQYRTGGSHAELLSEGVRDRAILEATTAVYNFFEAFNSGDNYSLSAVSHVPQIMLNNGRFLYPQFREAVPVIVNFDGLRSVQDWAFSTIESLSVIHATPNKVLFDIEFERFNSAGDKYLSTKAIWVLTLIDGKWGLEFRSLLAPDPV